MSREADFKARMVADTALMLILTGGVFTAESTGIERITRETIGAAFDANGYLKPCSIVRQRSRVPDGIINDGLAQVSSTNQVIEIWLYSDPLTGYAPLDAAMLRLYALFHGYQLSGDVFPAEWIGSVDDRSRDKGALKGSCLAKMDFVLNGVLQA